MQSKNQYLDIIEALTLLDHRFSRSCFSWRTFEV